MLNRLLDKNHLYSGFDLKLGYEGNFNKHTNKFSENIVDTPQFIVIFLILRQLSRSLSIAKTKAKQGSSLVSKSYLLAEIIL